VQAASPASIESLLRDAVDQDRAIQLSLKTVSKDRAAEALKDLQELLAAKSDDGDLDACLEIRERIRDLRNRYPVEQQLPEVLPTDEKEIQRLRTDLEEACKAKIVEHLDSLGADLGRVGGKSRQERRDIAAFVLGVSKERDVYEKVRMVKEAAAKMDSGRSAVTESIEKIDGELSSKREKLEELEGRFAGTRQRGLLAAIREMRVDDTLLIYGRLHRSAPQAFPVRTDVEVPSDLPEIDPECGRIMDRFESDRVVQEQAIVERLLPGVAELRRRLSAAKGRLDVAAKTSSEAVMSCELWLNSGSVDQLEEFRLIPTFLDLPREIEAGAFAEAVEVLLDDRHAERQHGLKSLQNQLTAEITRLITGGDINACVKAFLHIRWLGRRFDPIPARVARVPWESATVSVQVVNVAGRLVMVRQGDLRHSYWHPRRLVRAEGEGRIVVEPSSGNGEWRLAERFWPGPRISRVAELVPDQRVFLFRGSRWDLVQIRERDGDMAIVADPTQLERNDEQVDAKNLFGLTY